MDQVITHFLSSWRSVWSFSLSHCPKLTLPHLQALTNSLPDPGNQYLNSFSYHLLPQPVPILSWLRDLLDVKTVDFIAGSSFLACVLYVHPTEKFNVGCCLWTCLMFGKGLLLLESLHTHTFSSECIRFLMLSLQEIWLKSWDFGYFPFK